MAELCLVAPGTGASMKLSPEVIDAMLEAGLTREQIAAVVKASLARDEAHRVEQRERDAARQRKSRAKRSSVTVTSTDARDGLEKKVLPDPPKENLLPLP